MSCVSPSRSQCLHHEAVCLCSCVSQQILTTVLECVEVLNDVMEACSSELDRHGISQSLLSGLRLIELLCRHDKYRGKVCLYTCVYVCVCVYVCMFV